MEGGPPVFGQDFACPALLVDKGAFHPYGPVTRSGGAFHPLPVLAPLPLAWSPFARRYWGSLG